ncbi:HNH endonuclease family protein [Streptomyces sp. OfavH-34-F]|uniref:HNH endonuclease family protein n=1 Tax=Streptomyces sp. OfavH-34-F TaxID=2917760 RepID=UPI001EF29D27|nr:HNH endonuclease family protein [Streptomyces sp. OfavH-34-F]MCG7529554.1 HNH endonuclease family protein [Streptomyces sp. OfavH-34-F]
MVPALAASAVLALAGCDPEQAASSGPSAGADGGGAPSVTGFGASPLENADGTKPGLAPLTSDADKAAARKVIEKVATKGRGPKTGYARDKFGYAWKDSVDGIPLARNGCDTRNDLLARDGKNVELRSGSDCVVVSMTLKDPYTGKTIEWRKQRATAVQIDHVMPLSYDWQMGAAHWNEAKRQQIANDPLNLLPVDGPANNAKRDAGPATWLPPYKPVRCAYALRFAQVSLKYALPVTAADKDMMLEQCGG